MADVKPVRFGIIGCGSAAVPVGRAMQESDVAAVVSTFDTQAALAVDMATRFGGQAADSLEALLADPRVDAVYIAVPHDKLAMLARKALEAGKHALVEKPIALTVTDADNLIDLADSKGLALGVFYELRHTPAYAKASDLIKQGAIGTIIAVQIMTLIDKPETYWQTGYSRRSVNPWRAYKAQAGGGVVLMNASHALDAVRYVTGLEIVSVSAEVGTLALGSDVEVEDTAAVAIRFDNGAIGSLLAGAHFAGADGDERFDVFGTLGQLRLPDPYATGPLKVFLKQECGGLRAGEWHTLQMDRPPVYQCAVDDFARAVQQGRQAPTSGRDARRTLAAVLGIYQSAQEQKAVKM
jgi:predicted dehydrogenase